MPNFDHLVSDCRGKICRDLNCKEAVKQNPQTGNWFITMGHAGFNTVANNISGYISEAHARNDFKKYTK